jgi:diaminohydroxyphosphoribosylaminopyrimidine deaminase/5-amino-6-(5-phosphoribosylamino)uracil reductase
VAYLRAKGVEVNIGLLEEEGRYLNRHFIVNQREQIPYVSIKIAKSSLGYIGKSGEQVWLSNQETALFTHKLRSEVDAIMVGTNTAVVDNPKLNNRIAAGPSPIRILLDRQGRVPTAHHLLSDNLPTIIYTTQNDYCVNAENKTVVPFPDLNTLPLIEVLKDLFKRGISSLLIEGGAELLQNTISDELWHEAYIIETDHPLNEGIKAPIIEGKINSTYLLYTNKVLKINSLKMKKILF